MNIRLGLSAALLGALLMVGSAAGAATTLDILGSAKLKGQGANYTSTTLSAILTCSLGCQGIDSTAVTNTTDPLALPTPGTINTVTPYVDGYSDLFIDGNSSSPANEALFVKAITGVEFSAVAQKTTGIVTSNPVNPGDPVKGSASFTTSALYILLKIGNEPNLTIIKNTGGLNNLFTYTPKAGEGAGLSHYSEFGTAGGGGTIGGDVPLPAGLPLLLSGVGVMAFVARRKARKA